MKIRITSLSDGSLVVNSIKPALIIPPPDENGRRASFVLDMPTMTQLSDLESANRDLFELWKLGIIDVVNAVPAAVVPPPATASVAKTAAKVAKPIPQLVPKAAKVKPQVKSKTVVGTGKRQTKTVEPVPSLAEAATANLPAGHPAHKAEAAPAAPPLAEEPPYSEAFIDINTGAPLTPRTPKAKGKSKAKA